MFFTNFFLSRRSDRVRGEPVQKFKTLLAKELLQKISEVDMRRESSFWMGKIRNWLDDLQLIPVDQSMQPRCQFTVTKEGVKFYERYEYSYSQLEQMFMNKNCLRDEVRSNPSKRQTNIKNPS